MMWCCQCGDVYRSRVYTLPGWKLSVWCDVSQTAPSAWHSSWSSYQSTATGSPTRSRLIAIVMMLLLISYDNVSFVLLYISSITLLIFVKKDQKKYFCWVKLRCAVLFCGSFKVKFEMMKIKLVYTTQHTRHVTGVLNKQTCSQSVSGCEGETCSLLLVCADWWCVRLTDGCR